MGSQTLEVVRLGLWASLTGGWFYDPHQGLFTNTVHFYLWMFLVLLPFSLYLGTPSSSSAWIWPLYSIIIGIFLVFIKLINHRLHNMFDGEEIPQQRTEGEQSEEPTGEVDPNEHNFPSTSQDGAETIQLQVLSTTSQTDAVRTSVSENNEMPETATESAEALQTEDHEESQTDGDLATGTSTLGDADVSVLTDSMLEKLKVHDPAEEPTVSESENLDCDNNPVIVEVETDVHKESEDDIGEPSEALPGLSMSDVTVTQNPLSVVLRDLSKLELPFLSPATNDEPVAKNNSDVDQSHDSSTDTVEPVLGAGCAELYPEVERPSNPHLDESTNLASSNSSGLKDITRPGTPMPGRVSRKSSSHDPESRDIAEILQRALGPGEDRLSDTEMPSDGAFSLSRTRSRRVSKKHARLH